jgi:tape measure domain-containing protein
LIGHIYVEILPDLKRFGIAAREQISRSMSGVTQSFKNGTRGVETAVKDTNNRISGEWKRGTTQMGKDSQRLATQLQNDSTRGLGRIRQEITRFASQGVRQFQTANRDIGTSLDGLKNKSVAAGVALGGLAAFAVTGLARMGANAVRSGLQTAAAMEQAQIGFETLLGSGQKASTFIEQLKTFAAKTPFELPGLIDASRQLIGVGLNTKETMTTLQAYGDAAGGLGISQDGFNRIMLATSQALSAGTLHAGDLLQMTEAGLPVWKLLSEALHKPVSEIRNLSETGQLMTKDVLPKLNAQMEKDYGGAMAKQSMTLNGLWSTLMDTFHQGIANALIPMEPMLRKIIPAAGDVMAHAFKALGTGMSQFFNGLSGNVKKMDQDARPKLELFGLGLRGLWDAFKGGGVTSDGFVGAMERIGGALHNAWIKIKEVWDQLSGPLSTIFHNFTTTIGPVFLDIWKKFHEPISDIAKVLGGALLTGLLNFSKWAADHKTEVENMATAVGIFWAAWKSYTIIYSVIGALRALTVAFASNPLTLAFVALAALTTWFIITYQNSQTFRDKVNDAFRQVRDFISGAVTWLRLNVLEPFTKWWKEHWPEIEATVKKVWHAIQPVLADWWRLMEDIWNKILKPFVKWIVDHWPEISAVIKFVIGFVIVELNLFALWLRIVARVLDWFVNHIAAPLMHGFLQLMSGTIEFVKQLWEGLKRAWDRIGGALSLAWQVLQEAWRRLVAIFPALVATAQDAWNRLKRAWDIVQGGLQTAWNTLQNVWRNTVNTIISVGGTVIGWFSSLWSKVSGALSTLGSNVYNWFAGLPGNMARALEGAVGDVVDWFKGLPGKILSALGIQSPPDWAISAGKWIIKGVLKGAGSLGSHLKSFFGSLAGKAWEGITKLPAFLGKLASSLGAGFIPGGPGSSIPASVMAEHAYAASLFPSLGWSVLEQMDSLISLWNGESGWNPNAVNAESGAWGIPQSLPASKMASAGPDYLTNPATQIRWGLGYIKDVYGTPSAAWAAWLSRSPHWYAGGLPPTLFSSPTLIGVGESGRETVTVDRGDTRGRAGAPGTVELGPATIRALAAELSQIGIHLDGERVAKAVTKRQNAWDIRGGRR